MCEHNGRSNPATSKRTWPSSVQILPIAELTGNRSHGDQLARDVSIQFRRLKTAVSSYRRESIRLNGDEVQELLEQRGSASATAFLIVHRIWDLKRKALYTWRNGIDGWRIVEATILEEQLSSRGFSLGLLPPPLTGGR